MKTIRHITMALTLGLAMLPASLAFAQGRPDTLKMSCAASAELVRRSGAVVLGTGPDIYDRFVATQAYCQRDEQMVPRWLASGDSPQCFVGYVCQRLNSDPSPN